jgi:hypothetical protein
MGARRKLDLLPKSSCIKGTDQEKGNFSCLDQAPSGQEETAKAAVLHKPLSIERRNVSILRCLSFPSSFLNTSQKE